MCSFFLGLVNSVSPSVGPTCTHTHASCRHYRDVLQVLVYVLFSACSIYIVYVLHARIARWLPHYNYIPMSRGQLGWHPTSLPQRPLVMASPPGTFSCSTLTCSSRSSTSPLLVLPPRLKPPLDLYTTSRFSHCVDSLPIHIG